jgi:hypothetical protein
LVSECGQLIRVIHPGRWNLLAGPDFLGAHLEIVPTGENIRGDVEIDVHPSGWHLHGHDTNPDFQRVAVHVTWEPHRETQKAGLPASVLRISLSEQMKAQEKFSFEQIDLTAYPYQAPSLDAFPARIIQTWPMDRKKDLLLAAGQARLIRKVERLDAEYAGQTMQERLYQELCGALGYRNNRRPFQELAARLDWDTLQSLGHTQQDYAAVLLGQAGLLPDPSSCKETSARPWVRQCWDHWWQVQGELDPPALLPEDWSLRSIRPVNHPRRRMIALAALCAQSPGFFGQLEESLRHNPTSSLRLCESVLGNLHDALWDRRLSLNRPPGETMTALIGTDRICQVFNNGVIPAALSLNPKQKNALNWSQALLPEPHNQITRESKYLFFGPDAPRTLGQSSLQKLGLLQLFEDWVLKRNPGDEQEVGDRLNKLERWLQSVPEKRD